MSLLPVKKIYIDAKYKTEKSNDNSKFSIELEENVTLPENTVLYVDDIQIPNSWYTIQPNFNNKIYMRINSGIPVDGILTLTTGNYNSVTFPAEVSAQINATFASPAHTVTFNSLTNTLDITFTGHSHRIFTDDELTATPAIWGGPYIDVNNLSSTNEILNNHITSSTYSAGITGSYYLTLNQIRNIYISSSNLTDYTTRGPRKERNIIKKVFVNASYGNIISDQIHSSSDYVNVSNLTLSRISFELRDVNGNFIQFNGSYPSFSLVFEEKRIN
jgi:hypothetical protein